jgi:hypothetical protein
VGVASRGRVKWRCSVAGTSRRARPEGHRLAIGALGAGLGQCSAMTPEGNGL